MYSIISAEITENTIAETTGLQLKHNPIATPARPAWERASPMEESHFNTILLPINGVTMEMKIAITKALCIKAI